MLERSVEVAFANVCNAVQLFAFPRFKPIVRAVDPLYVPEKVSDASVEVRFASETSAAPTVAQVAAPRAESERANWLVQEVPVYCATKPTEFVRRIDEGELLTVNFVVDASAKVD